MAQLVNFIVTFCAVVVVFNSDFVTAAATQQVHNTGGSEHVNSLLLDNLSWTCANNASCLYSVANSVIDSYDRGDVVNFGIFNIEKLPPMKSESSVGRSSGFVDFLSGNAVRVPLGPMVFSIQRATDDDDYIEIALLKKSTDQGRRSGSYGSQRLGHRHKDKKQFQMFVPMYLAATTFGWTMLAVKAVGLLTLKALAISKLALILAGVIIVKKLMDNASEKLMYPQYPEHQPFIMPYNMDYGIHALQGADIGTGEMYPLQFAAAAAAAANGGHPQQGMEHIGAESSIHQVVDVQNGTQVLAGLAKQIGHQQKIKRDDTRMGATRPFLYSYLPTRSLYNRRQ